MPLEVLQQAAAEMTNWQGSGMGVMEMSHRGKEFISIYEQAEANVRELLAVPTHFKILFMQGGGLAENAIVPLNLSRGDTIDVVVTGSWSEKSFKEASKYCTPHLAATGADSHFTTLPRPGNGSSVPVRNTCTFAPTKPFTVWNSTPCLTSKLWAVTHRW